MGVIVLVVMCTTTVVALWWIGDLVTRRHAARMLAAMVIDPEADHRAGRTVPVLVPAPPRSSCWVCNPYTEHRDGHLCPDCRLLLVLDPDRPLPLWDSTEDDPCDPVPDTCPHCAARSCPRHGTSR
ncbi:hypothetical protein ACIRL2_29235 [Embleya sp. NPDC127516]|uniref:hypothetical protein n=1 Tax=Embleya sp. NPDC127516 TaxID=3363990 RepID=UPI0037FF3FB5